MLETISTEGWARPLQLLTAFSLLLLAVITQAGMLGQEGLARDCGQVGLLLQAADAGNLGRGKVRVLAELPAHDLLAKFEERLLEMLDKTREAVSAGRQICSLVPLEGSEKWLHPFEEFFGD